MRCLAFFTFRIPVTTCTLCLLCCFACSKTSLYQQKYQSNSTLSIRGRESSSPLNASENIPESRPLISDSENILEGPTRLFGCGGPQLFPHSFGIEIATDVFPRMNPTINPVHSKEEIIENDATIHDLLVYYLYFCKDIVPDDFPGKTLVVSGEAPYRMPAGDRVYYLGPRPDSPNSVRVPFITALLNARTHRLGPQLNEHQKIFNHALKPKNNGDHFLLYAASNCVSYREDALVALSRLGTVHRGGQCGGGLPEGSTQMIKAPHFVDRDSGGNANFEILQFYRFALVMENQQSDGYVTEKILNAFLGGSIPIYFGTTEIFEMFNPNAFIYYDIDNPQPALDRVAYLESNKTAYESMLNDEPILADGHHTIERFFSFGYFGEGTLGRRIRSMMGYESPMYHFGIL
mmetsp:Transcript_55658/g.67107  ORF Transcript_55658/g.67107 Transcript_55658/m.67107 type:complete len:405 (+) Transcript_55658:91-1305(+)